MINSEKLKVYYFRVTEVWKYLCEQHNELFNLTCDEYVCLLSSNIEELELKAEEKAIVIETVGKLEKIRSEIINDLNNELGEKKIENVSQLLDLMLETEIEKNNKYLFRFNALLIDIIEKIQKQSKKNQLFINKALGSLRDIREQVTGTKSYSTYNARGTAKLNAIKTE